MSEAIVRRPYGTTRRGEAVEEFVLVRTGGVEVRLITFGATVTSLWAPGADGRRQDVVLGFGDLASYEATDTYFGATVGRYANRIARAEFELDGARYRLAANEGEHHLHGGSRGFDKRVWLVDEVGADASEGIVLARTSPDGEEGYPGTLDARVRFRMPAPNELRIDYEAVTDAATIFNPTHHGYFNLAGEGSGTVEDHRLTIGARAFTPVGADLIPTGEIAPVDGTPFDFRRSRPIGEALHSVHPQLDHGGGFDHNWVLDPRGARALSFAAQLHEPSSGRLLELWTTEPGLQFYAGGVLDGAAVGKSGIAYGRGHGLALEPQHFPDSPNRPEFPPTILRPGEAFRSATSFRFGTDAAPIAGWTTGPSDPGT